MKPMWNNFKLYYREMHLTLSCVIPVVCVTDKRKEKCSQSTQLVWKDIIF